jgi:UDP-N-acetylmuramoyl-tripeptide--D-alanyl-D-alanine ligase
VPDTVEGLQALARGYRMQWRAAVVGITGSVGKTTVKELCAEVLSVRNKVHRTAGNLNNHIGLPLTMLAMPADADTGLFEIGMNRPGEIGPLTALLNPDTGILTDIGNAHRERFASVDEIAAEKAELAWHLPETGMVILDRDSEWHPLVCSRTAARIVTVSMHGDADYVGHASDRAKLTVQIRTEPRASCTFDLPLPGGHMMRNALRAVALGFELGLSADEVAAGLRRFKSPPMRWQEMPKAGILFINDAYNANPLSMRASLRTFAELPGTAKKWAVLGGMRELGASSEAEHAALGRFVDELALDGIIAVGRLARQIGCHDTGRIRRVDTAAEAAELLKSHLRRGDRVLLKASRGEKLEQVLEYFKEM